MPGPASCPTRATPTVRTCSTLRLQKAKEERHVRRVECEAHAQHPPKAGLIADSPEKDACGVGFVGELTKEPSRKCVTDALSMLVRMTHRGACGCEENTGMPAPLSEILNPPRAVQQVSKLSLQHKYAFRIVALFHEPKSLLAP